MVDIDRYNEIRSLLVTASAATGCSPVLRLSGTGGPVPSWAGAPVRVLGMADAGRSVWLARVEHDGSSWVFSGPSFAVSMADVGGVGIVHDPDNVVPVAGADVVDPCDVDPRDVCQVDAIVDVELTDGDHYRARVLDTHVEQGALLVPTVDNGGGAAGNMDPDQLASRYVAWGDIACAFPVVDRYAAPVPETVNDPDRPRYAAHVDPDGSVHPVDPPAPAPDRFVDRFAVALDDFKRSARVLRGAWEHVPGDIVGNTYPTGWDDFAEVFAAIDRMSMFGNREPLAPMAPRVPVVGERVVFTAPHDAGGVMMRSVVPAGMPATVHAVGDDSIDIRPDDPTIQAELAKWDGCIVFSIDDGLYRATDDHGPFPESGSVRVHDVWSPLEACAFGAWAYVAPLGDQS